VDGKWGHVTCTGPSFTLTVEIVTGPSVELAPAIYTGSEFPFVATIWELELIVGSPVRTPLARLIPAGSVVPDHVTPFGEYRTVAG